MVQEGGQSIYEFEICPWDGIIPDNSIENGYRVKIEGYIAFGRQIKFTNAEFITVDVPLKIWMGKAIHSGNDFILECNFTFKEEEIEECGLFWYTEQDLYPWEGMKLTGELVPGIQSFRIPEGVRVPFSYTVAFIKTAKGTYYSSPMFLISYGSNMTLIIYNSVTDKTFERVTVEGECLVVNEEIYPITERGFCYSTTTQMPTLNQHTTEVKRVPDSGSGVFSSVIDGLLPSTTY